MSIRYLMMQRFKFFVIQSYSFLSFNGIEYLPIGIFVVVRVHYSCMLVSYR